MLRWLKRLFSYDLERDFFLRHFTYPDRKGRLCFREMSKSDIPKIVAIEQRAYPFPWSEAVFKSCLKIGYCCRVGEIRGEIVAYGILSIGAGEAHVMNLCVAPEWQGQGLGREMLEHLLETAQREGVSTVFLEVRPSNTRALALYRKLGFVEIGVRKDYYPAEHGREDAIIMAKTLLPSGNTSTSFA